MRTFWILVGLLVLAAAAFALMPSLASKASKPAMDSPPVAEWPSKKSELAATSGDVKAESVTAVPTAESSAKPNPPASTPVQSKDPAPQQPDAALPDARATKPIEQSPTDKPNDEARGAPTPSPAANATNAEGDKIKKDEAVVEDVVERALGGGSPAPAPIPETEKKLELKQTPVKIERKSEDEVVLDGSFTVKGRGTKENPYVAPWELIVLAQDTYDPGQSKEEIPGAVMFLDGKHVRLTGYVCFPMYVPEPKEMLSMLNQWDGCCIGVPPTPYDAVEVHLAKKVGTDDRYAVYGSVEGVFRVKPYLSGKWLVGLYLLEEAAFKPSDKGGGS